MDVIPEITLNQIRFIKSNLIDQWFTGNTIQALGNAGRLLNSWVDGILEFTILKHEVVVLRLKNKRVLEKIQDVSRMWPKKKEFIEGAYKLLLFTKGQRKYSQNALEVFKASKTLPEEYFDYGQAFQRIMRAWYEKRIKEEAEKNIKLKKLHDSLLEIKELRDK